MKYDPNKHHRRSTRLQGYDYASPGAYFVTICVHGHECLLGDVVDGEMRLNPFGQVADDFWNDVPPHFARDDAAHIAVDAHVTMPNHIHAIITIDDVPTPPEHRRGADCRGAEGAETAPLPDTRPMVARPTLGQIVAYYKYQTTKRVNEMRDMLGTRLWQRNYWEHVIRSDDAYQRMYEYVRNNPALWDDDQLHPNAPPNRFNRG